MPGLGKMEDAQMVRIPASHLFTTSVCPFTMCASLIVGQPKEGDLEDDPFGDSSDEKPEYPLLGQPPPDAVFITWTRMASAGSSIPAQSPPSSALCRRLARKAGALIGRSTRSRVSRVRWTQLGRTLSIPLRMLRGSLQGTVPSG